MRWSLLFILGACCCGCWFSSDQREVVAYTALDAEYSEPIFADFTRLSGVTVLPKFDVESTKTVGLVNAIIAEAARPRCDVFWNNEILNTIRLEEQGLLEVYPSPEGQAFPAEFRSASARWHGFAARARILIVNTELISESERPASIYDLLDAKWKGKIGIAKPLFGTTATQAACLFAVLGEAKATEFFRKLKDNDVQILAGNAHVAQSVAAGRLAFGLTDTDDAMGLIAKGEKVAIIYPDSQPGQLGTLFIPNTVAIPKGCPHPEAARRLVDYLLSPVVEEKLAKGPSAQIPLNPAVDVPPKVETPATIHAMEVDFHAAAKQWQTAADFIRREFAGEN